MLEITLGTLAGFFAIQWFRSELTGQSLSIILERRDIYPSDDEIRDASQTALERMFSRQK